MRIAVPRPCIQSESAMFFTQIKLSCLWIKEALTRLDQKITVFFQRRK